MQEQVLLQNKMLAMSNNNEILLDNSVPSSLAHLIETREQLMLQHGGVATRIAFDKVEQFDLHTFLKTVVPCW